MSQDDSITRFVNEGVRAIAPAPAFSVTEATHRLHWNENSFDYPADLKAEVLRRMAERPWGYYPDSLRPQRLIEQLAASAGVSPDRVVADSGSSALIGDVFSTFLGPGKSMVMTAPTFLLYRRMARLFAVSSHEHPSLADDDFRLPVANLIDSAHATGASAVILCAPNNPTGTVYPLHDIRRVVEESGTIVVIDEAYREFCHQDLRPLLEEFDNVVLLRTFSKAYALAGLRIGYALTSPALARELQKCIKPFPISTFSEIAATVALEYIDQFQPVIATIVAERERMSNALQEMPGITVFPSGTNFLLAQLERPVRPLAQHLAQRHSLLISTMDAYPELSNCIRISVGRPEQNTLALKVISEQLASTAGE